MWFLVLFCPFFLFYKKKKKILSIARFLLGLGFKLIWLVDFRLARILLYIQKESSSVDSLETKSGLWVYYLIIYYLRV